ncbi:MAG: hypothetical protein ACQETB_03955 [Halobacteriota archaeon]
MSPPASNRDDEADKTDVADETEKTDEHDETDVADETEKTDEHDETEAAKKVDESNVTDDRGATTGTGESADAYGQEATATEPDESIDPMPFEGEADRTTGPTPEDAIEPDTRRRPIEQPTAARAASQPGVDHPAVESRYWYWVAAVPLYVLVGFVGSIVAAFAFLFGVGLDVAGGAGAVTILLVVLFGLVASIFGLFGVVLLFAFPIGIYLDATAIADADVDWEPDAVLYGLLALGSAIVTAFTLSLFVALYYLYRRHEAIGDP